MQCLGKSKKYKKKIKKKSERLCESNFVQGLNAFEQNEFNLVKHLITNRNIAMLSADKSKWCCIKLSRESREIEDESFLCHALLNISECGFWPSTTSTSTFAIISN